MKLCVLLLVSLCAFAQVRPVPPPGVEVPANDRAQLEEGLKKLRGSLDKLRGLDLLPDVQIFYDAVRYALEYNEFFKPEDIARGKELLRQGQTRADQLAAGKAPWTTATGLVVRGYVSKIDRSVQPYSLVIPESFAPDVPRKWRLDAWFHGRGETLSEVNFLYDRQRNPGEFTPPHAFVLHLYGRYCNANKFAGEVDLFEALESVKRHYPIDENRIVVRGFSMGGAAAWQFATHFAGDWAAAAPGAGFSETADFLKIWERESVKPAWWEQKLWHLYDATDYAANLYNLPVVAYSGEIDRQIQAARMMENALADEGMKLTHVIGPNTPHRYHPDSKVEIDRIIDAIAEKGRDPYAAKVRFTTWTLAYNRMKWVVVDGLEEHWERARVDAEIAAGSRVHVKLSNVNAFTLDFGPGACPFAPDAKPSVVINGQALTVPGPSTDRSWRVSLRKTGQQWQLAGTGDEGLRKRHGLQGPIDDAFMDSFLFVRPTGASAIPGIAKWVEAEQARAVREWRRQFRGDAQVRNDVALTDEEIARNNLVLWGDPGSNKVLAKIADRLPVRWINDAVIVGSERFPAATHVPVLIYPNPLNPKRYVVLNSGFTYREYDYLNNARQVPKLPDWAVIDTTTPPDERWPGKVVKAGFFGENWELKAAPQTRSTGAAAAVTRANASN
jgi:dienelactone hydrolase